MVKTAEKKEIRQDFRDRMLAMLNEDRDVFIQTLMDYVDDIGLGIAMDAGKENRTFDTMSIDELFASLEEE